MLYLKKNDTHFIDGLVVGVGLSPKNYILKCKITKIT